MIKLRNAKHVKDAAFVAMFQVSHISEMLRELDVEGSTKREQEEWRNLRSDLDNAHRTLHILQDAARAIIEKQK